MRNSEKNTRRITAVTLAVALCVAVYLNWEYAKTDPVKASADSAVSAAAAAGDAAAVSADAAAGNARGDAAQASAEADSLAEAAALTDEDDVIAVSDGLPTEEDALLAADKNYGEAQLVSVSKDSGAAFFEQARLDRTKTRDGALDDLEKSLKKSSLSKDEKTSLTDKLATYLEDITKENEIETLVKAKGFADCLCFLQDGKADLSVMTPTGDGLDDASVAKIRDIVLKKCPDLTAQDITIVEVK